MDISTFLERIKPHWLPITLGLAGVMFLIYGVTTLSMPKKDKPDILFEAASTQSDTGFAQNKDVSKTLTVDVEGAVEKPGVYDLPSDARVQDALIAAGGMSDVADREKVAKGLNLAAKLVDGGKVYIPQMGEEALASNGSVSVVLGAETSASGSLNINTASASDLDKLSGVGQVTAEKIISNRPYGSIEELVSKKVVSKKVFDSIKDKISVY